jgi:hypothetical protein
MSANELSPGVYADFCGGKDHRDDRVEQVRPSRTRGEARAVGITKGGNEHDDSGLLKIRARHRALACSGS